MISILTECALILGWIINLRRWANNTFSLTNIEINERRIAIRRTCDTSFWFGAIIRFLFRANSGISWLRNISNIFVEAFCCLFVGHWFYATLSIEVIAPILRATSTSLIIEVKVWLWFILCAVCASFSEIIKEWCFCRADFGWCSCRWLTYIALIFQCRNVGSCWWCCWILHTCIIDECLSWLALIALSILLIKVICLIEASLTKTIIEERMWEWTWY